MSLQNTKYDSLLKKVGSYISQTIVGPWKRRSIGLIMLLTGYYIGTQVTSYFIQQTRQRFLVVILMVIIIELMVRARNRVRAGFLPLYLVVLDNIRLGAVYAVVLEAFKLGS